jgi:hypothetical protein
MVKTSSELEEETNQTNTKTFRASDIVAGRISLDNLPQPYVIMYFINQT